MSNWLIPYLNRVYRTEYFTVGFSWETLCNNKNIKILWRSSNNIFYDIFTQQTNGFYTGGLDYENDWEDFSEYINNDHIYAIANATMRDSATSNWINSIDEISTLLDMSVPMYVYNPQNYTFSCNQAAKYEAHANTDYYDVIVDFLNDADLASWHNYDGACEITHKAISIGIGGWMFSCNGFLSDYPKEDLDPYN